MENLFAYGVLQHAPLLETVLGHPVDMENSADAILPDTGLFRAGDGLLPVPALDAGSRLKGKLISGLGPADFLRLDFYMGGHGFAAREITIFPVDRGCQPRVAQAFLPFSDQTGGGRPWPLSEWRAEWGDLFVLAAEEAMAYFTHIPAKELAARMPMICNRAASRLRARDDRRLPTLGRAMTRDDVKILSHDIPYSRFFAMQEYNIQFRRFSGGFSESTLRAAFTGFDAVIVLPYDPVSDRVVLVEQMRIGAFARGALHPWVLEPVAGHVDLGETPEDAARREAREEAGLHLTALEPISRGYPSPGCSTEYYYIFLGLCALKTLQGGLGGLKSEHEDIRYHVLSFERLMKLVDSFEAENGTLELAAHWLARNRKRLRKRPSGGEAP